MRWPHTEQKHQRQHNRPFTHLSQSIVLFVCQSSRQNSWHWRLNSLECSTKSTALCSRYVWNSRSNWRIIVGHSLSGSWKMNEKKRVIKWHTISLINMHYIIYSEYERLQLLLLPLPLWSTIVNKMYSNIKFNTNHFNNRICSRHTLIIKFMENGLNSIIDHICFKI